ncbi:MAG: NAD-dependent epimerase/dehydratase family protein [Candidatus Micrarchaeota archaeon]
MIALVTGASGRIGSVLVRELLKKKKIDVRALIRKEKESARLPEGVRAFVGDITRIESMKEAVRDADYVFHLAALVDYSAPESLLYDVNVKGTDNILKLCCEERGLKSFLFCSTIGVHGRSLKHVPADEGEPFNPGDRYNGSKFLAERTALGYRGRVPVVVVRPAVVYGAGFEEAYFPIFELMRARRMPFIGSGENYIPFVHVSDVVQGMLLASEDEDAAGSTYILAGDETRTQREVFVLACRYLNVPPPKISVPVFIAKTYARIADALSRARGRKPKIIPEYVDVLASNRAFDITKAKKELEYEPKVKLEDGIREMAEDYLAICGR